MPDPTQPKKKRKKKKRRTRTSHPGVTLTYRRRRGREECWAKWKNPVTGIDESCRLDTKSLTEPAQRIAWAQTKSKNLAREKAKVAAGVVPIKQTAIAGAIKTYLDSCLNRLRPATVKKYRLSAEAFGDWLKDKGIKATEAITMAVLSDYRDSLLAARRSVPAAKGKRGEHIETEHRLSPATINHDLRHIKAMLNDWRIREYVPSLNRDAISDGLKTVSAGRPRPEYLPPESVRQLLEACLRHDADTFALTRQEKAAGIVAGEGKTPRFEPIAPLVAFLLTTGCRIGEALNLRWQDVNLEALDEHGHIVGEIVLLPTATKTNIERAIDLAVSPACHAILSALKLKRNPTHEFVFGGEKPLAGTRIEAARKRLCKTHGAPEFTWQKLRQSCGTYLTNAPGIFGAASAYRSARQLGHSVAIAERHYVGLIRGIPRDAHTIDAAMQATDLLARIVESISGKATKKKVKRAQ